jgi:alkanesulfonate monooxygenase SsuD/methylene tetrahydromethanopterin reductase-like flavin-dependent oxidoreductase (luciferase family)
MEPPTTPRHLGFGLVGRPVESAAELAPLGPELERLGYDEVWVNDGRRRSALDTLAALAEGTARIDLCVGVTPLDERPAAEIAARVAGLGLPHRRLVLGVGSGGSASLELVRRGVSELRALLPDVRIAVSALGPRMCRLAGEVADVVLLNWTFPERVDWARERVAEGALPGRGVPRVAGYVRVAIGPDADVRLSEEASRYARRPRSYGRLFAEQRTERGSWPGVAAATASEVRDLLRPYREALDSCVVRAMPAGDALDDLVAVAEAAAR